MQPWVIGLVAVSAILHLAWNVRLKTAGDPLRAATIGMLAASVGIVPLGIAVVTQGGDVVDPVVGIGILGLAAAAFTGVGLAVGGLVRSSLAAGVTGVLIVATLLLDTLGAALKLPQWILDLSLYKHLGQPMAGSFDPVGLVVAAIMTVGGLVVCTWGLTRRDVGR